MDQEKLKQVRRIVIRLLDVIEDKHIRRAFIAALGMIEDDLGIERTIKSHNVRRRKEKRK